MTEHANNPDATEAAQSVVDKVTAEEYGADKDRIGDELDSGLDEAGVELDDAQRDKLVDQIDDLKQGEAGRPDVDGAQSAQ